MADSKHTVGDPRQIQACRMNKEVNSTNEMSMHERLPTPDL